MTSVTAMNGIAAMMLLGPYLDGVPDRQLAQQVA